MKKRFNTHTLAVFLFVAVFAFFGLDQPVFSTTSKTIQYEGVAVKPGGVPFDGFYPFLFTIYDRPSGGRNLWQEIQDVEVMNGKYRVELGVLEPFFEELFQEGDRYLEVTHAGDVLASGIRITNVGYARMAEVANSVGITGQGPGSGLDADTLDGRESSEYTRTGAMFIGHINKLGTLASVHYALPNGYSLETSPQEFTVAMLSPHVDCLARNLSVKLTTAPGGDNIRVFTLRDDGEDTDLECTVAFGGTSCNSGKRTAMISAGSVLALKVAAVPGNDLPIPKTTALFGWECK